MVAWHEVAWARYAWKVRPVGHGVKTIADISNIYNNLLICCYFSKHSYLMAWRPIPFRSSTSIAYSAQKSASQIPEPIRYIQQQEEHHRTRTFQEEYLNILKKHEMTFDEKHLWTDRTLNHTVPYGTDPLRNTTWQ